MDRGADASLKELAARLGPKGFTRDAGEMASWLSDWRGRTRGAARALVSPANVAEVQAIVRHAAATRTPIVPQGGNSSMVAGATPDRDGRALLLSLRRMTAIRSLAAEDGMTVAEAGVVLETLHEAAAGEGMRFPLSLAAKGSATVGGLVSTNAGGTQVLRFGTMRALVTGIEAVMPDGSLFAGLSPLAKDNRGYDLKQLLIGAEGTLGVVTAAGLRLVSLPAARAVAWAGLATPAQALALLRRLKQATGDAVESFELVPAVALDLVLRHVPGTRAPLAGRHDWHALIEATAPAGAPDPGERLTALLAEAIAAGLVTDATVAVSETQAAALWRLREGVPEAERVDGPAVKHDVAVPVSAMPDFIQSTAPAVEQAFAGARVIAFGHLGDGNVHFNVRAPEHGDKEAWVRANTGAVNRLVHDRVGAVGGSISAEHGIGQTRLAELMRTADPVRLAAMRAIKQALDPLGIMNPGKLVPLAPAGSTP